MINQNSYSVISIQNVHGYCDKNGTVFLSVEDVARGLGFVDVHIKKDFATSGEKYETVRWARVNGYLHGFGYSIEVRAGDFLPENMVYRLAMKANNEVAQIFQAKLADEILPQIRKYGFYSKLDSYQIEDKIERARRWIEEEEERRKLAEENARLIPQAKTYQIAMSSDSFIDIGTVSKILNIKKMGRNNLFKFLRESNILMSNNRPYQQYVEAGYFKVVDKPIKVSGNIVIQSVTHISQKGMDFILGRLLKAGYTPRMKFDYNKEWKDFLMKIAEDKEGKL